MSIIYHITTVEEWHSSQEKGFHEASSLATEGFIHCSKDHQVEGVLQRYFQGHENLVKLTIDTTKLKNKIIYEWASMIKEEFPHVYGVINADAVIRVEAV